MRLSSLKAKARELLSLHGLNDWTFTFDRSVNRFGRCNGFKKQISMSRRMAQLNDEARCVQTLLHEIAHALVGVREGHGPAWKAKALEIGCSGERCFSSSNTVTIAPRWAGYCQDCGKLVARYHRRRALFHRPCRKPTMLPDEGVIRITGGKIIYKEAH